MLKQKQLANSTLLKIFTVGVWANTELANQKWGTNRELANQKCNTHLLSASRMHTMENAQRAGLDLLNAVEPIGPEHTPELLVAKVYEMKSVSPIQTGAMKRIAVPGSPFATMGEINHFKLSQIVSVQCLALADVEQFPWIGIHEPCEAGYLSGANLISAETGVNPRDTAADTAASRGLDMDASRRFLYEAGFIQLAKGGGTHVSLTMDYINSLA